uniref:Uncharacterized protein n=1 Tax=Trepomonas sp. PC1 TaxID=1076344 RepID=A0A146K1N8_9EUKA|eukprot:JAP90802.1 Hypothetical protein TPC1_17791 [Trepomonas sp. PC1]
MKQQEKFTDAIRYFVREKTGKHIKDKEVLMKILEEMDTKQRWGIWKIVSEVLNITTRQAHDYYHNTWCVQFFEDSKQFKQEVKQLFIDNLKNADEKAAKELAITQIMQKYPKKKIHRTSLQRMLNAFKDSKSCNEIKLEPLISKTIAEYQNIQKRNSPDYDPSSKDIQDILAELKKMMQVQ